MTTPKAGKPLSILSNILIDSQQMFSMTASSLVSCVLCQEASLVSMYKELFIVTKRVYIF